MKKIAYLLGIIVLAASCQKVIDVDLNESNKNIIIEGNFTAADSTVRVTVSLTSSYFDSEVSPLVDNAIVTMIDGNGASTLIPSIGNGQYELANYIPNYGTTYTLEVVYEGVSYKAECALPTPVQLEPITYQYFEGFFGSDPGYAAFLNFNDPAGQEDFYQIILGLNGTTFSKIDQIFTQDDVLTDGNLVQRPLFADDFFQLDDTVYMELRTVSRAVYDYTNELQSISGGSNSAAPGNPTTNWDNGALGYFNAYGTSIQTVVIQ